MTTTSNREKIIETISTAIEIPDDAYQIAESRYQDIGKWFGRRESNCGKYEPHILSQGSFRLGTVNRPLEGTEVYDLDLSCKLRSGITKDTWTQEQLKALVRMDVEDYRVARGIKDSLEEMHRCWRLKYADRLSFHMDIVPCIPEELTARVTIEAAMMKAGSDRALAQGLASLTVSITDDRHHNYRNIAPDWKLSNPEGYAQWFETRMRLATTVLEKRLLELRAARIEELPAYRWKTPLQRCIQFLKRHRDVRFKQNSDSKPISIIITTLAARAYRGEADLGEAMQRILTDMGGFINANSPRVPNPVNPAEDFADKWATPDGRAKKLEENFYLWLAQAQSDFKSISQSLDEDFIASQALQKLGTRLDAAGLGSKLARSAPAVAFTPKSHRIVEEPARPWSR